VNSDCYLGVLNRLWAKTLRIRPEYREQGSWSLLHDNAPPHKLTIVRDFLDRKGITVLDWLQQISGCSQKWSWRWKEIVTTPSRTSKGMYRSFKFDSKKEYSDYFQKLVNRFQLCIDWEGDYFEYLLTYGAEPFLRSFQLCSHSGNSQQF
jgi:hypothetical protein